MFVKAVDWRGPAAASLGGIDRDMGKLIAAPNLAEGLVFILGTKLVLFYEFEFLNDVSLGSLLGAVDGGNEVVIVVNPSRGEQLLSRDKVCGIVATRTSGSRLVFLDARQRARSRATPWAFIFVLCCMADVAQLAEDLVRHSRSLFCASNMTSTHHDGRWRKLKLMNG